jgi:hypothetical protein
MKHIKKTTPQIGDYVITQYNIDDSNQKYRDIENYINHTIGKIYKIDTTDPKHLLFPYYAKYKNIPENILWWFGRVGNNGHYRSLRMKEILDFSPNKEDLLVYIAQNKFNL